MRSWALLAAAGTASAGPSGHAYYDFPAGTPAFDEVSYDVNWATMPKGHSCYASYEFYWGATTGYMGSQFHGDGTQILDFAIWDYKDKGGNSRGENSQGKQLSKCDRFGGEGQGSHCEATVKIEIGKNYTMTLSRSSKNATGATWMVTWGPQGGAAQTLGRIFWDESTAGVTLGKPSGGGISFQEYYADGSADFDSSVGFIGPFGTAGGKRYTASAAQCRSDSHMSCDRCIPGAGCGAPNVLLFAGPKVKTGSGAIWTDPAPVPPAPAPAPSTCAASLVETTGGYLEACGGADGNEGSFSGLSLDTAKGKCCADSGCAGFSFDISSGSGFYKKNTNCGKVSLSGYVGYSKPEAMPKPRGWWTN